MTGGGEGRRKGMANAHTHAPWYTMEPCRISMTRSKRSNTSGGGCCNATRQVMPSASQPVLTASTMSSVVLGEEGARTHTSEEGGREVESKVVVTA